MKLPLVFTALGCLCIQQVRHAKAVNTNLINKLIRGILKLPQVPQLIIFRASGKILLKRPKPESRIADEEYLLTVRHRV